MGVLGCRPLSPASRAPASVKTMDKPLYDPFSAEILDDPHPVYRRLREEAPVYWLEEYDSWALSRFDDIWDGSQDPGTYRSGDGPGLQILRREMPPEMAEFAETAFADERESLFSMNPPGHTGLRSQISGFFTPGRIRKMEAGIREYVRECVQKMLPQGRADVIDDLASRLAVRVTCMVAGLPLEDADFLRGIVARYFARQPEVQGMPPDAFAAMLELRTYLEAAVADKRAGRNDRQGVLAALCGAEVDGQPLTDSQVGAQLSTLVVGGTETLPKVFAGGILQLARHPDQRALLVKEPGRIPDAFTEIARMEMPTNFLARTLARDVSLHGEKLREGHGVLFLYRSANRDPREFPDPDRFDVDRRPPRILSFGHGTHVCLGQWVARLEGRVMLEELLREIPDYQVDEEAVVPARSDFVAGYLEMPITFEPR